MTERSLLSFEVEAALNRAAWLSVHGTAEDRNGRYKGEVPMASRMPPPGLTQPAPAIDPPVDSLDGRPGPVELTIETVCEGPSRWLASVPQFRGASAYGLSEAEAVGKVQALALRMLAARIDRGETRPTRITVQPKGDVLLAAE